MGGIDKSKVIITIANFASSVDDEVLANIIAMVEQLPTTSDDWVSVENRLPKPEDFYLVYAHETVHKMWYGLHGDGHYYFWYEDDIVRPYMYPTHWQPLPTPPQP